MIQQGRFAKETDRFAVDRAREREEPAYVEQDPLNVELRKARIFFDPANGVCEFCGKKAETIPQKMGIWNYGVRTLMTLQLCKECSDLNAKGEL
jgi:hypothetical protein